jgi:hypothetical protein
MPHFDHMQVQENMNQLRSLQLGLQTLEAGDALLSTHSRQQIAETVRQLATVNSYLEATMPQPGFMDSDVVYSSLNMLTHADPVEAVRQVTQVIQSQAEEKRIALLGYEAATHEQNKPVAEQFANDYIAELAGKLRAKGVRDEEVSAAVAGVRRYIDDAIAQGTTYPDRIVRNREAPRKGGDQQGQKGESRQIVAEMAVDLLRGGFDVANTPQDIVINHEGAAVEGQHRAAALMTLYGKDWLQKAKTVGFRVTLQP